MSPNRFLKLILCLFISTMLWQGGVGTAAAHAVPVTSSPAPNAILETPPTEITITFSETTVPALSQIKVLTQLGQAIEVGALQVVDSENRILSVSLPSLNNGAYLVNWQVLSAVDGHTTTGSFSFGVGIAELTAASSETTIAARISPPSAASRWLILTGFALLLGLFAFRLFVWNPLYAQIEPEPEEVQLDLTHARASLKVGLLAVGVVMAGLVLTFVDQTIAYNLLEGGFTAWLGSRFGMIWLVRLFFLLAIGWQLSGLRADARNGRNPLQSRENWFGLTIAFGFALTTAFISHSAALQENTWQATGIDLLHTLAAGVWVGGLVYLMLALWLARQLSADSRAWLNLSLTLNFSSIAAFSVGLLLVSGTYLAVQHVGSWTALVGTAYGLLLLAKITLVVIILLIAALNLLVVKPRLNKAYDRIEEETNPAILGRFGRLVQVEMVVALLILATAGVLTDLQRGVDAPLLADAPGKSVLEGTADDLTVTLTMEPALVGQNSFDIYLSDESGNPITDASEVSLRYVYLDQSLGASDGMAMSSGDGHYHLDGSYISLIGNWQIEVAVRRPDAFDTFVPFRLEAGLGGNIRPLESGGSLLEWAAKWLTLLGSLATGTVMVIFAVGWGFLATRAAKNEWQLVPMLLISLLVFWLGSQQLYTFFDVEYTPTKFLTNPVLPDADSITAGEQLYTQNCVPCHGAEGRGDGISAAALNPPPADFAGGHTATHPDGDLFFWIQNGIDSTPMPAFGDKLSEEEIWHLVNYVRRLSIGSYQTNMQ